MKFITKFKSPNFDSRKKSKISFIILHYTALSNANEAISYLCDIRNKVSSHFLISQKGRIYMLVNENKRAWHAGVSYWNNQTDINSKSIGIEIDYSPENKNNKFTRDIVASLKRLIKYLSQKYKIDNTNILGHSDIAPYRKIDPGIEFPWNKFYNSNLIHDPSKNISSTNKNIKRWFIDNNIKSNKKIAIFILSYIGYDTSKASYNNKYFKMLLAVYKMRYSKDNVSRTLDSVTLNLMIDHFLNLVLTKK